MTRLLTYAVVSLLALMSCGSIHAGIIVRYNFTGQSGDQTSTAATIIDANVTATGLVRGAGLTINSTPDSMNSGGWSTAGVDLTDYYGFSLTPISGYQVSLTSISFAERRSATGIAEFQLRSSLDGFSTTIAGSVTTVPDNTNVRDQSLSLGAAFTSLSGNVEFRLYGYEAEGAGGTWRLQNHSTLGGLVIDGTTSPIAAAVPEPASFGCVAAVCSVLAWRRRRTFVFRLSR